MELNISRFFAIWKLRLSPLLNPQKQTAPATISKVTGGITGNRGTASSLYEVLDENTKDNRRYLYVLPTFRWHWFTRPKFSLYTSAGLGAYFLRNSFGGEVFHKTKFSYQFSFLGIEYGSRFAFFTEFGVGYTGTIVAGGRYRF